MSPKPSYNLTERKRKYSERENSNLAKTKKTTLANSPINLENLKQGLKGYHNRIHVDQLLQGFTHGFKLGFTDKKAPQMRKNLSSVAVKI